MDDVPFIIKVNRSQLRILRIDHHQHIQRHRWLILGGRVVRVIAADQDLASQIFLKRKLALSLASLAVAPSNPITNQEPNRLKSAAWLGSLRLSSYWRH